MRIAWRMRRWTRRRASDDGCHPSGSFSIQSIRTQKIWMARGTQLRDVDALGLDPGAYERVPGCHPAVEIPVAVAPFRGQSTHRRIALRSLRVDKEPAPELGVTESGCFESVAHVR